MSIALYIFIGTVIGCSISGLGLSLGSRSRTPRPGRREEGPPAAIKKQIKHGQHGPTMAGWFICGLKGLPFRPPVDPHCYSVKGQQFCGCSNKNYMVHQSCP